MSPATRAAIRWVAAIGGIAACLFLATEGRGALRWGGALGVLLLVVDVFADLWESRRR